MQPPNLFWPSDRKLFRQRSRARFLVPLATVAATLLVVLALGHTNWM